MSETTDADSEVSQFRFGEFLLDAGDRQLWRGDKRVALNARYLDALILLVGEPSRLVEKDRFFDEVWTDVVVSDSALAQCIKEIRKQLGDDAANPRFIETVPRYGYRFVADVELVEPPAATDVIRTEPEPEPETPGHAADLPRRPRAELVVGATESWRRAASEVGLGTVGGGTAGIFVGLLYGFGLSSSDAGAGTLSTLLVVTSLSVLAGAIGGAGIGLGLAGVGLARRRSVLAPVGPVLGAAIGGLVVGATAKLLGVDAFNLLFGRAPAGITGGGEGAAMGAALAFGALAGVRRHTQASVRRRRATLGAAVAGGVAGGLLPLMGGRMMGGSLDLVARSFADSRLELDRFGALLGEVSFGLATQVALGVVEGFLFGFCVMGALWLLRAPAAYRGHSTSSAEAS